MNNFVVLLQLRERDRQRRLNMELLAGDRYKDSCTRCNIDKDKASTCIKVKEGPCKVRTEPDNVKSLDKCAQ